MCNLLPNIIFDSSVIAVTLALQAASEFPHDSLLADVSKNFLDTCDTPLVQHLRGNESNIFGLHQGFEKVLPGEGADQLSFKGNQVCHILPIHVTP